MTSQLRRAAVSGPSNIAEGAAGRTQQQFSNYLSNAIGSFNEIDTQLELALRLGYVTGSEYDRSFQALDECLALTYGLKKIGWQQALSFDTYCLLLLALIQ